MFIPVKKWLIRLNGHEGGYSNRDPIADPGGETKWGISKRSYPHLEIENLTLEEAEKIYWWDYLHPLVAKDLPLGITFQLFDFAVNSGIGTAIKQLQKALGLVPDGDIGPITKAKISSTSDSDLVMKLTARRIRFMKSLKNWEYNHNGWMERLAQNLDYGAEDTD